MCVLECVEVIVHCVTITVSVINLYFCSVGLLDYNCGCDHNDKLCVSGIHVDTIHPTHLSPFLSLYNNI